MLVHKILKRQNIGPNELVLYLWDNLDKNTIPKLWENVELLSPDNQIIWTVNGMDQCQYWRTKYGEDDFFVDIGNDGDNWILNSYSGHSFILDIETGCVTYLSFHK